MPKRIQRKRTKGWKMPENTVYVGRPTEWGNPYIIMKLSSTLYSVNKQTKSGDFIYKVSGFTGKEAKREASRDAVERFRHDLIWHMNRDPELCKKIEALRGKDLACWCSPDMPCHADVLLELANYPDIREWADIPDVESMIDESGHTIGYICKGHEVTEEEFCKGIEWIDGEGIASPERIKGKLIRCTVRCIPEPKESDAAYKFRYEFSEPGKGAFKATMLYWE